MPLMFMCNKLQQDDLLSSIVRHLQYLLNTKQGALQHLPDYGLPDMRAMCRGLPSTTDYLLSEILRLIHQYEPRIAQAWMMAANVDQDTGVFNITLAVQTVSEKYYQLHTQLSSDGSLLVVAPDVASRGNTDENH